MEYNKILVCPCCKLQNLEQRNDCLYCESCKKEYPSRGGYHDLYINDMNSLRNSPIDELAVTSATLTVQSKEKNNFFGIMIKGFTGIYTWLWVILAPVLLYNRNNLIVILFLTSFSVAVYIAYGYYDPKRREFLRASKYLLGECGKGSFSEYDMRKTLVDVYDPDISSQVAMVKRKGEKVKYFVDTYLGSKDSCDILVMGCGGVLHSPAVAPYIERKFNVLGVDIYDMYIREFSKLSGQQAIMANCLSLPLKNDQFDAVSMTDVLEHLHSPLLGLQEANRVLKIGGMVIITTPSRQSLNGNSFFTSIVFLFYILSFLSNRFLPARPLTTMWMGYEFYHTAFSLKELTGLSKKAGLIIEEVFSYDYFFKSLEPLAKKISFLKYIGSEWCVILRKK